MTYKSYTIYVQKDFEIDKKATKEVIEKARTKSIEEAKVQFRKNIKELIKSKCIRVKKDQTEPLGIMIEINTNQLEKVLDALIKMDEVAIVDAEFTYGNDQKPQKVISSQEQMKKFLE